MLAFSTPAQKQNWRPTGWWIQDQLWLSDPARVTISLRAQGVEVSNTHLIFVLYDFPEK